MAIQSEKYGLMVVAAPSGAGKSTLCTRLLADLKSRLALSISTTSREPRGQEVHGKEYFFVTPEEFRAKIDRAEFAEWALVHGNYYGTEKKTLQDFWGDHKHVLLDIDVQGADSLRTAFPSKCVTIFIAPPSLEELERRLRGRGTETEEAIRKRMANASQELAKQPDFDITLVNDQLDETYLKLIEAVTRFMDELEGGTWQKRR